jgi:protease IV
MAGEGLGELQQGLFDELGESLFTDVVWHGTNPALQRTRSMLRCLLALVILPLLGGCGIPSFLVTPVSGGQKLKEEVVDEGGGSGKIVLVEVEGMLLNARTGGILGAKENAVSLFAQELQKAAKDDSVRAVILRVNSPGGTVAASDAMHTEVQRFRERTKKPVIAFSQDMMASGAYYIACATDRVVVQPTSVVGSIGVIFQTFDFSGSLDKIGAKSDAIKSGEMKDMGSPFKPMRTPERQIMQAIVDDFHVRFRKTVTAGRKLEGTALDAVADGRVFTGENAVKLGLADQTGSLHDAIRLAREMGKAPGASVVLYKRPYGYGGSIYASGQPPAEREGMQLNLLPEGAVLPMGFYYLWRP